MPCSVVCRRITWAMTWNSSPDMGMTRSRSLLEGLTTSRATTSPLGALVVADAQVGQFAEFFDAKPGQAQRFNDRPLPEGGIFVLGDPDSSPPVRLSTRIGGFGCSGSVRVAMRCQVVPSTSKQWPVSTVRAVSRRMRKLVQRSLTYWERIGRSGCRSRVRSAMRSDSRRRRMWNWRTSVSRIGLGATQRAQRSGSAADQVCRSR